MLKKKSATKAGKTYQTVFTVVPSKRDLKASQRSSYQKEFKGVKSHHSNTPLKSGE
jgi:hypothetical protein